MVLQLQIFFRFLFEDSWPEALQLLCDREGEILRAKISMLRMAERASLVAQTVKNSSANAGDPGLTPGSERSPGERNGNPFQYSSLENPMDREAWRVTVQGVARSWPGLSDLTWGSEQLRKLQSSHNKKVRYMSFFSCMNFLIFC